MTTCKNYERKAVSSRVLFSSSCHFILLFAWLICPEILNHPVGAMFTMRISAFNPHWFSQFQLHTRSENIPISLSWDAKKSYRTFLPAKRPLVIMATRPTFMTIFHKSARVACSIVQHPTANNQRTLHFSKVLTDVGELWMALVERACVGRLVPHAS